MNKTLIELYLPMAGKIYDVDIPANIPLGVVIPKLAKLMETLTEGYFMASGKEILCNRMTGKVCDTEKSLEQQEIKTGSKLFLM